MSLKFKALAQTLSMLAGGVLIALVVNFILDNVRLEVILQALAVGFVSWFVYIVYGINLARLEYNQKLKEMAGNKKVAE